MTTPRDFWTTEKISKVKELLGKGWSYGDIGHAIDCGRNAISGKIMRLRAKGELPPAAMDIYRKPYQRPLHKPLPQPPPRPKAATVKPGPSLGGKGAPYAPGMAKPHKPRPRASLAPTKARLIIDIEAGECKFSTGEDAQGRFLFCSAPAHLGTSWCEHHHNRVINQRPTAKALAG